MKKLFIPLFALALLIYVAPSAQASDWVYLGQAHVDGQHDHDNIEIGKAAHGTVSLRVRVNNPPMNSIGFGPLWQRPSRALQVREVIRKGSRGRAFPLAGDRMVQSLELWYGKARPASRRPEVSLFSQM